MIACLKSDGYTSAQLLTWSYDTRQSNAVTAAMLAAKVDSVLRVTGATTRSSAARRRAAG